MSDGQKLGSVIGGIAGFFIGAGPAGALYGASLGASAGSVLDPVSVQGSNGPQLSDLSGQTSTYGASSSKVYGKAGILGNVIWLENNQIKEVAKKQDSGGKGGPSQEASETFEYFATWAVEICRHQVESITRVWIGPDLIYSTLVSDADTIVASAQGKKYLTFYLGTEDQEPNPRMQADVGVDDCSAYPGCCYVVIEDYPLAGLGNTFSAAQVKVEVASSVATVDLAELDTVNLGSQEDVPYYLQNFPITDENGTHRFRYTSNVPAGTNGPTGTGQYSVYHELHDWNGNTHLMGEYLYPFWATGFSEPDSPIYGYFPFGKSDVPATLACAEDSGSLWFALVGGDFGTPIGTSSSFWTDAQSEDYSSTWYAPFDLSVFDSAISDTPKYTLKDNYLYVLLTDTNAESKIVKYNASNYSSINSVSAILSLGSRPSQIGFLGEKLLVHSDTAIYEIDKDGLVIEQTYDTDTLWPSNLNYSLISIDSDYIYVVQGNELYRTPDLSGNIESITSSDFSSSGSNEYTASISGSEGLIRFSDFNSTGGTQKLITYTYGIQSASAASLADIVSDQVLQSKLLTASDIDVTGLTDLVQGYVISRKSSIRSNLEPLRACYPFDVIQHGYQIKFVRRGSSSVMTIPIEDLGKDEQWKTSREMDTQLASSISLTYLNADRNYDADEEFAERLGTDAVNEQSFDYPIVLDADSAAQVVDVLMNTYWLERDKASFELPPSYRALVPSDVVAVDLGYATHEVRITDIDARSDGSFGITARANDASSYTSTATGLGGASDSGLISGGGLCVVKFLDIPVVSDSRQNSPGFLSVMSSYNDLWAGGLLVQTKDNGQTWQTLDAVNGACVFGTAPNRLSQHNGNVLQIGGTLKIELVSGELSSVTREQLLNGSNYAAYGVDGRWEIIRFQNATLNSNGTYTLDTFWRGDKGTEWATGLHQNDDYFVILSDPDNRFISVDSDAIGQQSTYRGVTSGRSIDSAYDVRFTYNGQNLECYSPVHLKSSRNSSGDLSISWTRRARVSAAWRDKVDVPVVEESESYEIDILDGRSVVRTIESSTPSATYSEADQITDFGSAQSSIDLEIYQMSALVGRGNPLEGVA